MKENFQLNDVQIDIKLWFQPPFPPVNGCKSSLRLIYTRKLTNHNSVFYFETEHKL